MTNRHIIFEGGRNFRDAGGYKTRDGRSVRWGVLYRSGAMNGFTEGDREAIKPLGVRSMVDLRANEERARAPHEWLREAGVDYWFREYGYSAGNTRAQFAAAMGNPTREAMRERMFGAYRRLPNEQAPSYREMFVRLAKGDGPLILNCTAGKDRTGIGIALALTALGVEKEQVFEDYLLTNGAPGMHTLHSALSPHFAALPEEIIKPILHVEREYLETAFNQINQEFGSLDAYFEGQLGVGPKEIGAMQEFMLE